MVHVNCSTHPTIKTDRLNIRCIIPDDKHLIFKLRSVEETARILNWPCYLNIEQAENYIQTRRESIDKGECLYWAAEISSTRKAVGTVCLWNISADRNSAEIGYELLPEYQGLGIMNEIVRAVVQYSFTDGGFNLIEALPYSVNPKSVSLLERLNFKQEGTYNIEHSIKGAIGLHYIITLESYKNISNI